MAKTVRVKTMIEKVNHANRYGTESADRRIGHNSLLEMMLHAAGVYAGFGYYNSAEVPAGQAPGIIRETDTQSVTFPDDSRRFYYYHPSLNK